MYFQGHLATAKPLDGCSEIKPPRHFPVNDTAGLGNTWIALIKRENCDFDLKVLNAQRAGFQAAIVFNNESGELLPMGSSFGKCDHYYVTILLGNSVYVTFLFLFYLFCFSWKGCQDSVCVHQPTQR